MKNKETSIARSLLLRIGAVCKHQVSGICGRQEAQGVKNMRESGDKFAVDLRNKIICSINQNLAGVIEFKTNT